LFGINYERKNRLYFSELQQARRKELLRTSTRKIIKKEDQIGRSKGGKGFQTKNQTTQLSIH
jgi:hypothetical protein